MRFAKGIIWTLLLRMIPSLSYKGVVNTLVKCYMRIRKDRPGITENETLNYLINIRVEAHPRVATKQEELAHYEPLLKKDDKSLEEVILAIVEYEYISSREKELFDRLSTMGVSQDEISQEIENQKSQVLAYIRECIAKLYISDSRDHQTSQCT